MIPYEIIKYLHNKYPNTKIVEREFWNHNEHELRHYSSPMDGVLLLITWLGELRRLTILGIEPYDLANPNILQEIEQDIQSKIGS